MTLNASVNVRPRRPLVAGLLSVLCIGLGQLYNGQAAKGMALLALGPSLYGAAAWSGLLDDFSGLSLVIAALLCIFVYAFTDAYQEARKQQTYRLRRYNRWYVYSLWYGLLLFVLAPGFGAIVPVKSYRIPTGSMEPTVQVNDHILVRLNAYSREGPRRGDIIAYRFPMYPEREFLHRVVGLPGERIRLQGKKVFVDDVPLDEPYVFFSDPRAPDVEQDSRRNYMAEQRIPEDHYFTLGDNRDNAHDSRFWGYLPAELIRGEALYVYWSPNLSRIGTAFRDR